MAQQVIPSALKKIAAEVVQLLKDRKETVSVAETAAGGLISAALLSTPGASSVYKGGLTLYTLQSRVAFAGWTQRNLDEYRGPTPEIVAGLAENVRSTLESTYCVCEALAADREIERHRRANRRQHAKSNTVSDFPRIVQFNLRADISSSGYVALAVAHTSGTTKIDLDTGKGTDRDQNMLAFAIHALDLVKDTIQKGQKL